MVFQVATVDEVAKKGMFLLLDDGDTYVVQDIQYSRPGKHGHAKYRLKIKHIFSDKKKDMLYSGHDDVKRPLVEKSRGHILDVGPDSVQIIDLTTNETKDLPIPTGSALLEKLVAGSEVEYWVSEGKVGIVDIINSKA
ncbi:MAG: translation initiation factor IF-5A [Euryarchaeota archaeon HGW-Euryarchaeota-1]|nr:MAG: translation initiation factor IF-5A [Euryarchaeota archaeon HGW-Euryarchaeota-1]